MLPPGFRMPAMGLVLALGLVILNSGQAQANDDSWVPTTWTGVVAGAPVPGDRLPSAPQPGPLTPLPAGTNPVIDYEPQVSCDPIPKPGALLLERIIKDTYGARQVTWIPRGCSIGPTSEHKEGRAVDWMVSVREPQQRADAEAFLNWLLGPDQSGRPYGHALQLGVMYIGWHDRIWRGFGIDRGWQELKGCFSKTDSKYDNYCHRNHIHISLTNSGAAGVDPTGEPVQTEVSAPPPPEAPIEDFASVEQRGQTTGSEAMGPGEAPQVLVQPGSDADLFTALGSQLGYRTERQAPLPPGKTTTVQLAPIPDNATSALVSVTTRASTSETTVRVGLFGKRGNAASLRIPRSESRTSVLSVPVRNGSLQVRADSAPVQVRIDVLGYSVDDGIYPAVGATATKVADSRFSAGQVLALQARGVGPVPKKKSKVTAVILRVTAKGLGTPGRFAAYPLGGTDLGTTSAVVPAAGEQTSVVVADIGKGGQIALASSVRSRVKVEIVGYVQR